MARVWRAAAVAAFGSAHVGSTLVPRAVPAPHAMTAVVAHPMHTTLTEIRVDAPRHDLRATVRIFADDLGSASRAGMPPSAYIASQMTLLDQSGRALALRPCGVRREGDLLEVCLAATIPGDPRGLSLRHHVLCEVFADQVNIVRITTGSHWQSLLFTRRDGPRPLLP